ncbi:MAG TPA: type II toxin-antitoxin system VapC family toxin [Chloroflexia bacterium]|jgi:tRNA(fMet)-specific endonuclease VapC|nr:type II toxin-antitoxin system VapC family toxin [Chloroflexia bacterium]
MIVREVLLDTDTLFAVLARNPDVVTKSKSYLQTFEAFNISLMTRYELLRGLRASGATAKLAVFNRFCAENRVLPITDAIIDKSADIYAHLHRRGALIGDADIIIAATALVHSLILTTNNERHFSRVPGLQIDNWLK